MKYNKIIAITVLTVTMCFSVPALKAQDLEENPGGIEIPVAADPVDLPVPPDPGGDPGGAVPIDGGLSLLIAAGVGYGIKKVRESRNMRKS